jgi:hypothetical protein
MVRTLLRVILIVMVVIGIAAFFVGYRWGAGRPERVEDRPVGTTGPVSDVDTSRAREVGANVGETVAVGANKAERALSAASLTAKIKSKMTLDDTVDAASINVDTDGTVVTLHGTVKSNAERQRAVQLARETEGVTRVVDRLRVE